MSPDKLSVLVPYEDLVELLSLSNKFAQIEKEHKKLQQQYLSIMSIYSEILEKLEEIYQYL